MNQTFAAHILIMAKDGSHKRGEHTLLDNNLKHVNKYYNYKDTSFLFNPMYTN